MPYLGVGEPIWEVASMQRKKAKPAPGRPSWTTFWAPSTHIPSTSHHMPSTSRDIFLHAVHIFLKNTACKHTPASTCSACQITSLQTALLPHISPHLTHNHPPRSKQSTHRIYHSHHTACTNHSLGNVTIIWQNMCGYPYFLTIYKPSPPKESSPSC